MDRPPKKSDHCREVAIVERFKQESIYGLSAQKKVTIVERFKQESIYGLSAQKSGRCGEVTVSKGSTVNPDCDA